MPPAKKVTKKKKKKSHVKEKQTSKKKKKGKSKTTKASTKRKRVSKTKKQYKRSTTKSRTGKSKRDTKRKSAKLKSTKKRVSKTKKRVSKSKVKKKKVSKKLKKKPILKRIREFVEVKSTHLPFYKTFTGDSAGFSIPVEGAREAYMYASRANKKDPEAALPEVFEKAFIGAVRKGFLEPDDILIYSYGLLLRPKSGIFTEDIKEKILEQLSEIKGASVHHVLEEGTFALRINMGSPVSGILAGTVAEEMNKKKSILSDVYNTFNEYYDNDVDWFAFWDSEEVLYD